LIRTSPQATLGQNLPMHSIQHEATSRACVFAVCFCFLFSIAPHFVNLPGWVSAIVVIALGWRGLQNLGKVRELPKWMLIPLVLFGGIGVFAEYWTIVGRDAGLALLTVMTSFKFLESKRHRDMLILVFLCYFLIATHFLYSQSVFTAAMMFVNLIVITATLITLNQRDDSVSLWERVRGSSKLVGLSVPLMLILFVLVPRVPGPLWGLQSEQRGGVTGLSNHMSPGKISNLIRSNEVAFRVDFKDRVPEQNRLYWRGPVMAQYDGYTWTQIPRKPLNRLNITVSEPAIDYTVTLEPNGERWLLALDMPIRLIKGSFMTRDFQLTSKQKVNDLRRYTMQSRLEYRVGLDESPDYLAITRDYPEEYNPRTIAFGKSLAQRFDNPLDIGNEVLKMFRQQEYVYTLSPPALGRDSVDEFLFGTRRGFCEHYAGAFALIMRSAGVPARIVTGYQGGEYNRVGNYLIVRQSDAHAWTEIWIEGHGWVRVDPTSAVSPTRIEQGLDDALAEEGSAFRIQNRNPIFGNLLYSWDNMQHSWNDWVLNYDQRKQRDFLNKLQIGIESWSDMVFALVFLLLAVTALYWFIAWYRERPARPQLYERLFDRLLQKLSKRGFHKEPAEDTRTFLERLPHRNFAQREQIAGIIELYNHIKYGRRGASTRALGNLRTMIDSID
jgi:transglutaminase-like putative cysteine protease